jgi:hypothetical protein
MARTGDQLVDLVEQFRRQQADVVLERLKNVRRLVELAMSKHGADGVVMIDQVVATGPQVRGRSQGTGGPLLA